MHPAFDALYPGVDLDPPSSLLGGEALLAKVYDAVRSSAQPDGSNAYNTLLMVNFDEHGGTYDHVPPPPAPPPVPSARSARWASASTGRASACRPIAISAWIPERIVVTAEFRNTSVLRTLRERVAPRPPLTGRDAVAPTSPRCCPLDTPRPPEDWPDARSRTRSRRSSPQAMPPDVPLRALSKAALCAVLELGKGLGLRVPGLDKTPTCLADGIGHPHRVLRGPVPAPARSLAAAAGVPRDSRHTNSRPRWKVGGPRIAASTARTAECRLSTSTTAAGCQSRRSARIWAAVPAQDGPPAGPQRVEVLRVEPVAGSGLTRVARPGPGRGSTRRSASRARRCRPASASPR